MTTKLHALFARQRTADDVSEATERLLTFRRLQSDPARATAAAVYFQQHQAAIESAMEEEDEAQAARGDMQAALRDRVAALNEKGHAELARYESLRADPASAPAAAAYFVVNQAAIQMQQVAVDAAGEK